MPSPAIPVPEPDELDERRSTELRILSTRAHLKGTPTGDDRCESCIFYLEPTAGVSYCWRPELRILVGADWWCQWWEGGSTDV